MAEELNATYMDALVAETGDPARAIEEAGHYDASSPVVQGLGEVASAEVAEQDKEA